MWHVTCILHNEALKWLDMKYERDKNKMNKAEKFKEVGTMKKIFLTMLLVCVAVVFVTVDANAINGVCSGCHTMHDSQNNAAVASGGRQNNLLNAGCPTCHEGDGPGLELINGFGAPVILQVSDPGSPGAAKTLAAGDFWWVTQAEDATESPKGHNVIDLTAINGKDFNMPDTEPPGWDFSATNGAAGQESSSPVPVNTDATVDALPRASPDSPAPITRMNPDRALTVPDRAYPRVRLQALLTQWATVTDFCWASRDWRTMTGSGLRPVLFIMSTSATMIQLLKGMTMVRLAIQTPIQ
jgi:hypothetical protein